MKFVHRMLGIKGGKPGEVIVIRHRKYKFPSWTAMFDAARHGIGEYRFHETNMPGDDMPNDNRCFD